jgi:RNA recognition motif-containing protein
MSNDASETITVSDDGDEQQVVVAADAAADGAGEKKEMKESDHAVYVGNLAFTMTPDDVRALISEKVGSDVTIESVSMPTNSQNINEETGQPLSKGFCFVKVGSEEQVTKVVDAMNGIEVDGRAVRVNMIKPKDEVAAERAAKKKTSRDVPPGEFVSLVTSSVALCCIASCLCCVLCGTWSWTCVYAGSQCPD